MMSSLHFSYPRTVDLPISLVIALVAPLTASAAQYTQTYDFNTEDFKDKWDMSVELGATQVSFLEMAAKQDFQGVTQYLKSGPSAFLEHFVNTESIEFQQNSNIDIDVQLAAKFNVPETLHGDWTHPAPTKEDSPISVLAPSYLYMVRADAITNVIGMDAWAGYVQNDAQIRLSSKINSKLSAQAQMYLTTDNARPTDQSLNIGDSYAWEIHPTINATAYVDADISLVGMRAQDYLGFGSSAVNNGEISISGQINLQESTSTHFQDGIGSFEMNFENGYVLGVDTAGTIEAHTQWYGSARAIGLLGLSSAAQTSIINNGSIKIATSKEYTAAALAASADNFGTVYVSNRGEIDLSEAQTRYRHELYANLSGNGQVVIDDWLLSLDYLDHFVPFAIVSDSSSTGANSKLRFTAQSTLYLKPTDSHQLNVDLNLGTIIGTYTDSQTISSDLNMVDGFFSSIESATNMVDLQYSGTDANHLTARLTVNPEKSLGHGSRYIALTSDLNSLMTLQALTSPALRFTEHEAPKVSLKPWYYSLNDKSDQGFNSDGGGLVVSTETQKDGYQFTGYWAVAKERSEADNHLIDAKGSRYALGLSLNYFFNDSFSAGLRADVGKNRSDWDFKDKFGADSQTIESQYLYTEAHSRLTYPLSEGQTLSATAALGYLRQKQDGFDLTTLSTGLVSYEQGKSDSFLLRLAAQWQMNKELNGYRLFNILGLDTVYLTDPEFDTAFTYLDSHYKAQGEVSNWLTSLHVATGFSKERLSLELAGGYSVGEDLKALSLNARMSYRF